MDAETLKSLQTDIHAMAREKGWWDGERDINEVCANFHAELSEAWEEYRDGRKLTEIYFSSDPTKTDWHEQPQFLMGRAKLGHKPEGIPIELADFVIRVLDAAEGYGWDWWMRDVLPKESLALSICYLHGQIWYAFLYNEQNRVSHITLALAEVFAFCKDNNIDLLSAIRLKMAYNATRPYRHGKVA